MLDVWELPPIDPPPPVVDTPLEGPGGKRVRSGKWITRPVAVKWHDCSDPACRAIIGPGDPYYREAALELRPEGYTVSVRKLCHHPCAPT